MSELRKDIEEIKRHVGILYEHQINQSDFAEKLERFIMSELNDFCGTYIPSKKTMQAFGVFDTGHDLYRLIGMIEYLTESEKIINRKRIEDYNSKPREISGPNQ